ncbi:MAG: IPT/TIG domain-containing protein [Myxococcales bacterium]|nr:IPT/TIG domain-containing protein [Myxococcales bacterium]
MRTQLYLAPRPGHWLFTLCLTASLAAACSDDDSTKKRGGEDAGTGDGSSNGGEGGSAGNSAAGAGASAGVGGAGAQGGVGGSGTAGVGGASVGGSAGAGGSSGSSAGGASGSGGTGGGSGGAAGSGGGTGGAGGTGGTVPALFCGDGLLDLTKEECDGDAEGRAGATVTCDTSCKLKSWCNIAPTPASAGAPAIGCVFPQAGRASGGTYATISGAGFNANTTVRIGGAAATVLFTSATQLTFFAPAGTANTWADVVVENTGGLSATRTNAFAFHEDANVAMNSNDTGTGSLRATIAAASSGDFVTLDRFVAGQQINVGASLLVNKPLTIVGLGAGRTVLDGGGSGGVIGFQNNNLNELFGVTVTNGEGGSGAGVSNRGGRLTVTECAIVGNTTSGEGGGIYSDVGGYLIVQRSTISGNTGNAGAGIRLVGPTPQATVINSTISGNTGAGIFSDIPLTVRGSTIVGNSAAGIVARSGVCTISGSVVALNTTDVTGVSGFVSQGYNLIGVAPVGGPWGSSDKTGTSGSPLAPMLGALALNFGLTQTHLPLSGSPVLDAGDPVSTLTEDQARMPRPSAGIVDIGSVELQQ